MLSSLGHNSFCSINPILTQVTVLLLRRGMRNSNIIINKKNTTKAQRSSKEGPSLWLENVVSKHNPLISLWTLVSFLCLDLTLLQYIPSVIALMILLRTNKGTCNRKTAETHSDRGEGAADSVIQFMSTSHWVRQTNYHDRTFYFCFLECSSNWLLGLYLEAKSCFLGPNVSFCASVDVNVVHECQLQMMALYSRSSEGSIHYCCLNYTLCCGNHAPSVCALYDHH